MEQQGKRIEDEQQLHAVRFAAGVAALMACLERATLVSFFEKWRVWVFLALNLLLLAILFTSTTYKTGTSSTPPNAEEENGGNVLELEISDGKKKRTKKIQRNRNLISTKGEDSSKIVLKSESIREEETVKYIVENGDEKEDDDKKSKEELNERVEAFIAMFRKQYLVSDHATGRRRSL